MTTTRAIAAEYERRKDALAARGFRVIDYRCEDLLIIEMFVRDEQTGKVLIRKEEGVRFDGRSEYFLECRKLMALERLSNVVPTIWLVHKTRAVRNAVQRDGRPY